MSAVFPEVGGQYPSFYETFFGCTNLITIPSTLFAHITFGKTNEFRKTFSGCTGLTSLPNGLFSNVGSSNNSTKLFDNTFSGCTGLISIPSNLFAGITTGADTMFYGTFYGCSGLTSLPNGLFSNIVNVSNAWGVFYQTFAGCTGLTTIPGDLFGGITTGANSMFGYTFSGCTHLTSIPPNLFSNITTSAPSMFVSTFRDCTGLQSIPEGLFDGITTGAESMFSNTFLKCSGLKYLPEGLFSKITTPAKQMFMETFRECSDLGRNSDPAKNFIPPTFFKGLVDNGSPTASQIMQFTFYLSNLRTQCPENYYKYTTGYESDWNNKVSCKQCPNGKVSPAGSTNINQCARRDYVFSLNTTVLNANDEFKFLIAAKGTFFIDCGKDGVLTSSANDLAVLTDGGYRVVRTYANNATTYTCTYSTEGPKTIQFGGEATEYSNFAAIRFNIGDSNNANVKKIASISGSLGQIFGTVANLPASSGQPKFLETFHDATNMTGTIPPTLFDGVSGAPAINMFNSTFSGCSGLTGFGNKTYVPGDFLENIDTNTSISYQASDMFSGTQLDNPCPAGTYSVTRAQFNDAGKPWCTECPTGTTSLAGATDVSQCDQTITPSNPTTYTVTYICGYGGTAPVDNTPYEFEDPVTTPTISETVGGPNGCVGTASYPTFYRWRCNDGDFYVFPGDTFQITTNTTCYAQWQNGKETVHLLAPEISNWGTHNIWVWQGSGAYLSSQNSNTFMTTTTNPLLSNNIPSRTGYEFQGYYNQSQNNGTQPVGTKLIRNDGYITDDGMEYAKWVNYLTGYSNNWYAGWTPNTYTITYNLDGGTHGANHPNSATYDIAFNVSNPTRDNYTFDGWNITGMDGVTHYYGSANTTNTSISGTSETSFMNLRSTSGTVTFTAQWVQQPQTYTVTYHSGNCHPQHQTDYTNTTHSVPDSFHHPATGDTYTVNMDIGGSLLSTLFVEFNNMNFPTGNYDNCAWFDYWVDDNGSTYNSSINVSHPEIPTIDPYGSSNTNLYAHCTWEQIEAGFYSGTCSGTGLRLRDYVGTYGAAFSMPSASTANISVPANYHFSGWSTDPSATNVNYEVGDNYTVDVCVYTNDKNDEPYIKFYAVCSPNTYNINYHNVSNSAWANTYTYGVGASIGVPSRTGYTFLGWCVNNSNCSNYANNVTGYTISTTDTGDVDLYAMWQASQSQEDTVNLVWIDDGTVSQSVGNPSNSCSWGNSVFNLPTAKGKYGHTFIGWLVTNYVDDSCGLKYLGEDTDVNANWDSDHARWKPIDPTTGYKMSDRYSWTENSSDLSAGEWAVTFHYGTVKGMAKCSETNGTYATAGNPSDTPGGYCWCEITEYTPSGGEQCSIRSPFWVFNIDKGSLCESECAYLCAERVDGSKQFRYGVYGQTQSN